MTTRQLHTNIVDAKVTLELAMAALPRWPKVGQLERGEEPAELIATRQRRKEQRLQQRQAKIEQDLRQRRQTRATHAWITWNSVTRCATCLAPRTAQVGQCTGKHPLGDLAEKASEKGHRVWAAAVSDPSQASTWQILAVCKRCGGWSFGGGSRGNRLKLLEDCQPPTAVGRTVWSRVCKGQHPKTDKRYRGCIVAGLAPWPGNQDSDTGDEEREASDGNLQANT